MTTRAWVAFAAFGWVGPWAMWSETLAGAPPTAGPVLVLAAATAGAFALAPVLALPLAAAGWTLVWGPWVWPAVGRAVAAALAGAPVAPALYVYVGTLVVWLACGWMIASAAAAQSTRDRLEREARRAMLAWVVLAVAAWVLPAPERARLAPLLAGWLVADAAATLLGLGATQAAEFELKFGRLPDRSPWWQALALSMAAAAAAGAAAVALGHGTFFGSLLAPVGRLLAWMLNPVLRALGYVAEAFLWIFALVRPKQAQQPPSRPSGPPPHPPTASASPSGGALIAIQVFRGLVLVGLVAIVVVAWLMLRARHRPERAEEPTWSEERAHWQGAGPGGRPRARPRHRAAMPPTDVRLRLLFRRWLGWARRNGVPRLPAETAAEHLRRVLGAEPDGGAAAFLRAYEAVRYGAPDALTQDEVAAAEAGFDEVMRRVGQAEQGASV